MVIRINDKNHNYNNVTKLLVKPNKIPGSTGYTDNQGNMYDENGNKIGNLGDWGGVPPQFQNN